MSSSNRSVGPVLVAVGFALFLVLVAFLGWQVHQRAKLQERAARVALVEARLAAEVRRMPIASVPAAALGEETEWEEANAIETDTRVIVRVGRAPLGEALRETVVELSCERSDGTAVRRSETTDTIGVASFACVPGEIVREVWIPPQPGRAAGRRTLEHTLAPGRLFGASVLVQPGCRLEGRVVDEHGHPVAGSTVIVACRDVEHFAAAGRPHDLETVCDAEGRYAFDEVGPAWVVHARGSDSISSGVLTGTVAGRAPVALSDLHLVSARSLHGRVTDEAEVPIEGVRLSASLVSEPPAEFRSWPPTIARTDATGHFELGSLPRVPLDLEAIGPGGARESVRVEAAWDRADVLLRGDRSIRGEVLDASGAPVAGARIELLATSRRSATSDEDGRFHFSRLVATDGALFVDGAAYGSGWLAPIGELLARDELVVVHLDAPIELAGTLVDDTGAAVEGAVVSLIGGQSFTVLGTPCWRLHLARVAPSKTDAGGRFAFERLWPGRIQIEVRHPDEPDLYLQAECEPGGAPPALVWDRPLLRRVVIEGNVRDARTGAALEAFMVAPLRPGTAGESAEGALRSFHGTAGRFSIAGLAPGAYVLVVTASGYLAFERDVGELDEGEHAFDVELEPLFPVELAFVDAQGTPLTTGTVTVRRENGAPILGDGNAARGGVLALEAGRARVLVPAELLELEIAFAGGETLSYSLDPREGQSGEAVFVVDLDANATRDEARVLVLVAQDAEGAPRAGWLDELWTKEGTAFGTGELDLFDGPALGLTIRDRHGALVGRAWLERRSPGGWTSRLVLAHDPLAIVEEGELPTLALELPRQGFRLEARAEGFETLATAVEALRPNDLDSTRALVLRRVAR